MTDEAETVEAVIEELMGRGVLLEGERHLARLIGLSVVNRMREEAQAAQSCLRLAVPVRLGDFRHGPSRIDLTGSLPDLGLAFQGKLL